MLEKSEYQDFMLSVERKLLDLLNQKPGVSTVFKQKHFPEQSERYNNLFFKMIPMMAEWFGLSHELQLWKNIYMDYCPCCVKDFCGSLHKIVAFFFYLNRC